MKLTLLPDGILVSRQSGGPSEDVAESHQAKSDDTTAAIIIAAIFAGVIFVVIALIGILCCLGCVTCQGGKCICGREKVSSAKKAGKVMDDKNELGIDRGDEDPAAGGGHGSEKDAGTEISAYTEQPQSARTENQTTVAADANSMAGQPTEGGNSYAQGLSSATAPNP